MTLVDIGAGRTLDVPEPVVTDRRYLLKVGCPTCGATMAARGDATGNEWELRQVLTCADHGPWTVTVMLGRAR